MAIILVVFGTRPKAIKLFPGAIAQAHRRLYTSSDVENVDMRDCLGALIDELAETWSSDAAPRHLRVTADPIRLPTDRAVSVGVIVTELVKNACKCAIRMVAVRCGCC